MAARHAGAVMACFGEHGRQIGGGQFFECWISRHLTFLDPEVSKRGFDSTLDDIRRALPSPRSLQGTRDLCKRSDDTLGSLSGSQLVDSQVEQRNQLTNREDKAREFAPIVFVS